MNAKQTIRSGRSLALLVLSLLTLGPRGCEQPMANCSVPQVTETVKPYRNGVPVQRVEPSMASVRAAGRPNLA